MKNYEWFKNKTILICIRKFKMADKECVKVAVRCRPLSSKEITNGNECIVDVIPDRGEIIVTNSK